MADQDTHVFERANCDLSPAWMDTQYGTVGLPWSTESSRKANEAFARKRNYRMLCQARDAAHETHCKYCRAHAHERMHRCKVDALRRLAQQLEHEGAIDEHTPNLDERISAAVRDGLDLACRTMLHDLVVKTRANARMRAPDVD